MNNVYYDPQKFGLSVVDSLDEPDLSYEYNTLVVWKHDQSNRLYWAQDSGCSCPTPFESYTFKSPNDTNLSEITKDNIEQFETELSNFPVSSSEKAKCLSNVKELLKQS